MNLITKAVRDIQFAIPREILKMAYLESSVYQSIGQFSRRVISLDEAIRETTVVPRVVVDSNIVSGQTVMVSLEGLTPIQVDGDNYIYQIPDNRVNNRTIMSCLSVNYYRTELMAGHSYGSVPSVLPNGGAELSSSTARAMDSRSSIPVISTSDCRVVAHNTVMVRNQLRSALVTQARCVLEHDEELQNISLSSAPIFSKLCTFAAKSHVYNELNIKLDRGRIDRGHEIGAVKSVIESYSDAEENYWTVLQEEWSGVAAHSDRLTYNDLLSVQVDPSI